MADWASALTFGTSNLFLGNSKDLFGRKPVVPKAPDIQTSAGKAIVGAEALAPGAEKLVSDSNKFTIDEITKMLNSQMDYSGIAADISKNIGAEAKGEIPQDVADEIARKTAGQSLSGGYGGSGAAKNLTARDLGLTSLDLTNKATTSMEQWTKTVSSLFEPHMMDLSKMFPTYQDQYASDVGVAQRDWMQEQINAMPDPTVAGEVNLGMNTLSAIRGSPSQPQIGGQNSGSSTGGYMPSQGSSGSTYGYEPRGQNLSINFGSGGGADYGGEMGSADTVSTFSPD